MKVTAHQNGNLVGHFSGKLTAVNNRIPYVNLTTSACILSGRIYALNMLMWKTAPEIPL